MNPHKKETSFFHYLDEKVYKQSDVWLNTDFWVETGGLALVICTINCSAVNHANVGFRLVDENNRPLTPYRTSSNKRRPAHFTTEPSTLSPKENYSTTTFHIIVNCKWVKLQILPNDSTSGTIGAILINRLTGTSIESSPPDAIWNHKPISTKTAIPLLPHYQGGANTVFTYPSRTRMPRMPEGDKTPKSSGPS